MTEDTPKHRWIVVAAVAATILLPSCGSKPPHYYVICDAKDYNGWQLSGTESKAGYIIACTYQSPDKLQSYTSRCRENGCD